MEKLIKFLGSDYLGAVLAGSLLAYMAVIVINALDLYDDFRAWILGL